MQMTRAFYAETAITKENTAAEQAEQTIDATRRTNEFNDLLEVHLPADNFAWVVDTVQPVLRLSLVPPILTAWSSGQHKVSVMHAISVKGQAVQLDILAAGEHKVSSHLRRTALQKRRHLVLS